MDKNLELIWRRGDAVPRTQSSQTRRSRASICSGTGRVSAITEWWRNAVLVSGYA